MASVSLSVGSPPASAAHGGAQCGPGLRAALLIDRSASIGDHDPGGDLRLAVARAAEPLLTGARTSVDAFAEGLTRGGAGGSLTTRTGQLIAAGDAGDTDLPRALRVLASRKPVPQLVVVVTDAEPADPVTLPAAMRSSAFVFAAIGGEPPAWMDRVARAGGGAAAQVDDARGAAGVGDAIAATTACRSSADWSSGPGADLPRKPSREGSDDQHVVLIPGLRDHSREVRGVRGAAGCAPAQSLATWCRALADGSRRVWVAAAAPGGRGQTTLNSTGPLAGNGAALARWVDKRLPAGARPVYVGHSMGGLIAHAAIGWSGAPARALVTVGTPHGGSFGADAYLAAKTAAQACRLLCTPTSLALRGGAAVVHKRFGDAIDDLTRRRRTVVAPLPPLPPHVPIAAYAGAPNRAPGALTRLLRITPAGDRLSRTLAGAGAGYLLPNDGIVGVASALAEGTRLVPRLRMERGSARHSANVFPPGVATQLSSPEVTRFITAAIDRFGTSQAPAGRLLRPAREWPSPRVRPRGTAHPGRGGGARRITVPLKAVTPVDEFGPGEPLTSSIGRDDAGVIISADPIAVDCDGIGVDAIAIDDALYLIDLGVLGCAEASVVQASIFTTGPAAPRAALIGSAGPDWDGARGSAELLRRADGTWRLTIDGSAQVPRASCERAAGRVATRATEIKLRRIAAARRAPGVRRYRGTLGRRRAARCSRVDVAGAAPDGTALAASVEVR